MSCSGDLLELLPLGYGDGTEGDEGGYRHDDPAEERYEAEQLDDDEASDAHDECHPPTPVALVVHFEPASGHDGGQGLEEEQHEAVGHEREQAERNADHRDQEEDTDHGNDDDGNKPVPEAGPRSLARALCGVLEEGLRHHRDEEDKEGGGEQRQAGHCDDGKGNGAYHGCFVDTDGDLPKRGVEACFSLHDTAEILLAARKPVAQVAANARIS